MSKPIDLFRSFVRNAADAASSGVNRIGRVGRFREALKEIVQQRIRLESSTLTSVIAHLPGVESASVAVRDGAIHVDVGYRSGDFLQAMFVPERVRFAPRGAKEITFRVEPPAQARSHHVIDVASALGGAIAQTIWPVARVAADRDLSGAAVDRENEAWLSVDLRTAPSVRALEARGSAALILELLELGGIEARDGALVLQLKLPTLPT